jgi:hypothetical protein
VDLWPVPDPSRTSDVNGRDPPQAEEQTIQGTFGKRADSPRTGQMQRHGLRVPRRTSSREPRRGFELRHTDVFAQSITYNLYYQATTKRTPIVQRVAEGDMKMDSQVRREVRAARACVTPHEQEHTAGQAGSVPTVLHLLLEQVQARIRVLLGGARRSKQLGKSLGARVMPHPSSSAVRVGGESRARYLLRVSTPAPAHLEPVMQHDGTTTEPLVQVSNRCRLSVSVVKAGNLQ